MDNKDVIAYYDNFISDQLGSGINDRIYSLYKKLLHFGLKPDSNVLELGSGIGSLTFLLSKYISKGKIEAVDISPKSIQFSKERIKKKNITFFADDIVNYTPSLQKIDFILLFDIIEHIPIDKHAELFKNLSTICNENTKVLINIPNPDYLQYDIENNPESLQIIDQPLPLLFILKNIENNGLNLSYFETCSVWVENDYQVFVVNKKKPFVEVKLSNKRTFFQKAINKVNRTFRKIRYNYR